MRLFTLRNPEINDLPLSIIHFPKYIILMYNININLMLVYQIFVMQGYVRNRKSTLNSNKMNNMHVITKVVSKM